MVPVEDGQPGGGLPAGVNVCDSAQTAAAGQRDKRLVLALVDIDHESAAAVVLWVYAGPADIPSHTAPDFDVCATARVLAGGLRCVLDGDCEFVDQPKSRQCLVR